MTFKIYILKINKFIIYLNFLFNESVKLKFLYTEIFINEINSY